MINDQTPGLDEETPDHTEDPRKQDEEDRDAKEPPPTCAPVVVPSDWRAQQNAKKNEEPDHQSDGEDEDAVNHSDEVKRSSAAENIPANADQPTA